MSCHRYATAIADHACGADLAPDAAAHLTTCAACAALLDEQRRSIEGLDGELQHLLALEPSAHFVPRVQAHVRAGSAPRPRMFFLWSGVAAAAAVTIAAMVAYGPRSSRTIETTAAPVATTSANAGSRPQPPAESVAIERKGSSTSPEPRRGTARRRESPSSAAVAATEPEVLVPRGQMQAVERYIALVRSGRLDASSLVAKIEADPVPAELVLGPLEIGPMTVKELDATAFSAVEGRHEEERSR